MPQVVEVQPLNASTLACALPGELYRLCADRKHRPSRLPLCGSTVAEPDESLPTLIQKMAANRLRCYAATLDSDARGEFETENPAS